MCFLGDYIARKLRGDKKINDDGHLFSPCKDDAVINRKLHCDCNAVEVDAWKFVPVPAATSITQRKNEVQNNDI